MSKPKLEYTGYWIFICKYEYWDIDAFMQDFQVGTASELFWGITPYQTAYFDIGQRGVIRVGGRKESHRGIYVVVKVESKPYYRKGNDKYWKNKNDKRLDESLRVDLSVEKILEPPIEFAQLKQFEDTANDDALINGRQAKTWPLSQKAFERIIILSDSDDFIERYDPNEIILPQSVLCEGAKRNIVINKYERSERNRKSCLAYHGNSCQICGFNFDGYYGEDKADGFIHVHHLLPLAVIYEQYEARNCRYIPDPQKHLIPVCPNCHAMLHYGFPEPETFEEAKRHVVELKKRIERNQK